MCEWDVKKIYRQARVEFQWDGEEMMRGLGVAPISTVLSTNERKTPLLHVKDPYHYKNNGFG